MSKQTVFGKLPENTDYLISIDGEVLKKNWNRTNYTKEVKLSAHGKHTCFNNSGKLWLVHRAMAEVFPMSGPGYMVCHKNDKGDNRLENLYKGDHSDNLYDAYRNNVRGNAQRGKPAHNKGVGRKVVATVEDQTIVYNTLGLAAKALGYSSAGAVRNAILNQPKKARLLAMEFYNE